MDTALMYTPSFSARREQRGFVLVLALVFLLLLTLIGISAMSTTALEEKMAHNVKDKNLSVQAGETTLAMVQQWIMNQQGALDIDEAVVDDGLHISDAPTGSPTWKTIDWTNPSADVRQYPSLPVGAPTASPLNSKIYADQPRYIVEYIDAPPCVTARLGIGDNSNKNCPVYRVTTRAVGGTAAAVTVAQTTVKRLPN